MSKKEAKLMLNPIRALQNPWRMIALIIFILLGFLTLFFLAYGVSPDIDSYVQGYAGISTQTDSSGRIILYPVPGRDAQAAGIETFDVLLRINGKNVSQTSDISAMLTGKVGQTITLDVRKSDGSLKRYSVVLSSAYQNALQEAGLSANLLAGFYVALSLLIGLGFLALGVMLLLRHPADMVFILMAFTLILFPYCMNADRVIVEGVTRIHLEWLYTALRIIGFLLVSADLFLYPNGRFIPRWTRWVLAGVGAWSIVAYSIALDPYLLPGSTIVFAGYVNYVWAAIFIFGLGVQTYRYQRQAVVSEMNSLRQVLGGLLVAGGVFALIWLLRTYLPPLIFTDGGWEWFNIIGETLVTAGLLFLGVRLFISTSQSE